MSAIVKREMKKKSPNRRGRPILAAGEVSNRTLILEAALEEFSRNGFEGAKLSEIAARAQVVTPAVHYHFKTKDNLWKACMEYSFGNLAYFGITETDRDLQDLEDLAVLKVIIRRYIKFALHRPEHTRIIFIEGVRNTERSRWLIQKFLAPIHQTNRKLFKRLKKDGLIKPYSQLTFFSMLAGSVMVLIGNIKMVGKLYGIDENDEQLWEEQEDALVDILFNGILLEE